MGRPASARPMRAPDAAATTARPPIVKDRLLSITASLCERFLEASMRMSRRAETPAHRLVIHVHPWWGRGERASTGRPGTGFGRRCEPFAADVMDRLLVGPVDLAAQSAHM